MIHILVWGIALTGSGVAITLGHPRLGVWFVGISLGVAISRIIDLITRTAEKSVEVETDS